jgi:hypothetical protein
MAHQRIRKFNTKDTYPEQKLDNDLCRVVVAKGTMVFVHGRIGQDLETSKRVGVGDVAAQTEQAMKKDRDAARGGRLVAPTHFQDHDLHHRPALPGGCPACGRSTPQRRLSGLDRDRRRGAGPARMAGRSVR